MPGRFHPAIRLLHWTMALLVVAMLFIGVAMVSTAGPAYAALLALHRPIGIAILLLAALRLAIRLRTGAPPLPADLPRAQQRAAHASHILLYLAMIGMPLIGWAMLSAGGYPVRLSAGVGSAADPATGPARIRPAAPRAHARCFRLLRADPRPSDHRARPRLRPPRRRAGEDALRAETRTGPGGSGSNGRTGSPGRTRRSARRRA